MVLEQVAVKSCCFFFKLCMDCVFLRIVGISILLIYCRVVSSELKQKSHLCSLSSLLKKRFHFVKALGFRTLPSKKISIYRNNRMGI